MNPLLSVCVITYNHEKYIAQAIDSILMQETNFQFEIVIGEDCSIDNTRNILLSLKDRYPDKINLLLNKQNIGAIPNFVKTLKACKSKYVAICEGDDYWADPNKLQKQVDFLEANPEFSFCFHNAYEIDEETNKEYLFNDDTGLFFKRNLNNNRIVEGWELLNKWICPTASIVFRNKYSIDYSVFDKTKTGDIVLILSLAKNGKVFYFNQVSSVYRKILNGQRNAYNYDFSGKMAHFELLMENFKDIPFLESICSRLLCNLTYYSVVTHLRKNGIKDFKKNISLFIKYFSNLLRLKTPVNKLWFILDILYESIYTTAKGIKSLLIFQRSL